MKVNKLLLFILLLSLCLGCVSKDQLEPESKRIGKNAKEPPNLTIAIGEQTIRAVKGSYSWEYYDEEVGGISHTEVDALPPPELIDIADATTVHGDAEVGLLFDDAPEKYTVRVWDKGEVVATYEKVELSAYEGIVIYEIEATWEQGTVSYTFLIDIE